MFKATAEMNELLIKTGDARESVALNANHELAKAIETPVRDAVLYGNILTDIFTPIPFSIGNSLDFPLDVLTLGNIKEFVAYTIPNHGRIPERHVELDSVTVKTYEIAASVDWLLKFSRDGRWDVAGDNIQLLYASFVKKLNDDGLHAVLKAGKERNMVIYDAAAANGEFTKRLISNMAQNMRRAFGGNSASINRSKLTDLLISPEALEGVRNWDATQLDEVSRREIYVAQDGMVNRIFGVNLHDLDELGAGHQYQDYYINELGGTLVGGDTELVVGLDLSGTGINRGFVMPIREELQIFEDPNLHRQRRAGFYGWQEQGFGILNSKRVILGSL